MNKLESSANNIKSRQEYLSISKKKTLKMPWQANPQKTLEFKKSHNQDYYLHIRHSL
jgi:hypothetical protein